MKVFTIIKSESERVPGKNFAEISGRPLWEFSLSKFQDFDLYIDTDSDQVLHSQFVRQPHVTAYARSQEHVDWEKQSSNRGSPVESMFNDFIDNFAQDPDEPLVLHHVTSPFLKPSTLLEASRLLTSEFRSVHSVKAIRDFCFFPTEHSLVDPKSATINWQPLNFAPELVQRTQDLRPVFASLGAFFITTKNHWQATRRRLVPPVKFFELSLIESIEIDYPEDLEIVRRLAHEIG